MARLSRSCAAFPAIKSRPSRTCKRSDWINRGIMTMNILRSGAASAVALLMLTVAPGPLMSGAAAQEVTKVASGHTLAIQVNQGQLVRIDKPVESVFVANSQIADVAIKSPQLIYVLGKRP